MKEGSLQAPTRHPIKWKDPDFYNLDSLNKELERVFDICHGCRRCVSLCQAFPTLFDLVDESPTMEVDGIKAQDYWKVVDHCYLCDLCFLTKCPYVPPHEWNVDLPHLLLRAKAVKFQQGKTRFRDRVLTSTDSVARVLRLPLIHKLVNWANGIALLRKWIDKLFAIHQNAILPRYNNNTFIKRWSRNSKSVSIANLDSEQRDKGADKKVAIFSTCYCNTNEPDIAEDLVAVLQHNSIQTTVIQKERCCGMPKLELGDLQAVEQAKLENIPLMLAYVKDGWDILAPVPSCVLMYKQELPLMFPEDNDVLAIKNAIFDPFEYLMLLHKEKKFNTEFKQNLGKVAYHVACHLRVQNIGLKTRDILQLIPNTQIDTIERCSGHNGTYAVKSEFFETSLKIAKPVAMRVSKAQADYYSSDCPMAGHQIHNALDKTGKGPVHPLTLLRRAYGI